MGGIELAREIARIRPGMPVILMSGHTDGALNGPHPLLAKPFRRGALAAVLAQVVER
jgi:FixJ family two-component response regulator